MRTRLVAALAAATLLVTAAEGSKTVTDADFTAVDASAQSLTV
jgi:hypothetical protein